MCGWLGGQIDVDVWTDEWMVGLDGWMQNCRLVDEWLWMDELMYGCTDGGRTD